MAHKTVLLILALVLFCFIGATASPKSNDSLELTAHEWGTFTSIAGPNGEPVAWRTFGAGPSDLPCFVERFQGFKGGMSTTGTGASASRDLGRGWKVSPSVVIKSKTTYTVAEIDGPGSVQHIWMTPSGNWRYSTIIERSNLIKNSQKRIPTEELRGHLLQFTSIRKY